jgi:ribulose-5-phosphate 4-epimerase/fuculose-1-phosphate aldolase
MTPEKDLREQLATCTRIFAMQGLIGLFGHVSVYQPETKTIFVTPGSGSDKPHFQAGDMIPIHLDGKPLDGKTLPPVEWPIHTALHGSRSDALAVAHLHTPYAILFTIARREFHPVTLRGRTALQRSSSGNDAPTRRQSAEDNWRPPRRAYARAWHRRRRPKSRPGSVCIDDFRRRRQKDHAGLDSGSHRSFQRRRMP